MPIHDSGGLFCLKPVAMVLFMLCSAVLVEWFLLKHFCVEMHGILSVHMVVVSSLAMTDRSEMVLV